MILGRSDDDEPGCLPEGDALSRQNVHHQPLPPLRTGRAYDLIGKFLLQLTTKLREAEGGVVTSNP